MSLCTFLEKSIFLTNVTPEKYVEFSPQFVKQTGGGMDKVEVCQKSNYEFLFKTWFEKGVMAISISLGKD